MTLSPIGKVLSTFRKHRVRALLMGGQACIVYGAAEFSRDIDVAVLASDKNLEHLRHALAELNAEPAYVPPLDRHALLRGHASHFRIHTPEADGLRIDVMSVLHGCAPFEELWQRRHRVKLPYAGLVDILALPDLVQAKKTQRDKDWPMVQRLVEGDYQSRPSRPSLHRREFWFREGRTAAFLLELCRRYPGTARRCSALRPAIELALHGASPERIENALRTEQDQYRARDRAYWKPLRDELMKWRHHGWQPTAPGNP